MKKYRGSITVEVSMIFPLVLFSVISIIVLVFYLNDVVTARAVAYEYGIISNTSNLSEEEVCEEVYNKLSDITIISDVNNIIVKKLDNKTKIEAEVSMRYKIFNIYKSSKIKVEIYNESNREYIIKAKTAIDILNRVKSK